MDLPTTIEAAVYEIAEVMNSQVYQSLDGPNYSFMTPEGLCCIGVIDYSDPDGYIDLRWRVF